MAWLATRRPRVVDRLRRHSGRGSPSDRLAQEEEERLRAPLLRRLFQQSLKALGRLAKQAVTQTQQDEMRQQLMQAGYPGGLSVTEFAALKLLLAFVLAGIGLLVLTGLRLMGREFTLAVYVLVEMATLFAGYASVSFYLDMMVKKRAERIQKDLPDVLDLLTVAVEAGLGLDQALHWVGQRFTGPVGDELVRVVQETRMGRPRSEALRDLAARTQVRDLKGIARAIYQADRLGVQLGNVLRAQSDNLREERLMRGREQAQKAPVKMLVPLVLFIFPSLFIVLLGPAMIRATQFLQEANVFGR